MTALRCPLCRGVLMAGGHACSTVPADVHAGSECQPDTREEIEATVGVRYPDKGPTCAPSPRLRSCRVVFLEQVDDPGDPGSRITTIRRRQWEP